MSTELLFQERFFTLRVNGETADQILCSKGNWRELGIGYLLSQGRIGCADEILAAEEDEDEVRVRLKGALRPNVFLVERLSALTPFAGKADADDGLIRALGRALQENAPFGRHRAIIRCGGKTAVFDDAGRHNACDKAIGYAALEGWAPRDCILGTSGRLSLEMLGKAACSGIPLLFTLKYPSDLCYQYADRLNLRLVARAASEAPVHL